MILGIDLGSSSFKSVVFGSDLEPRGSGEGHVPYSKNGEHLYEMPVRETEDAFRASVSEALRSAGVGGSSLRGVSITSQAQTFTIRAPGGDTKVPFISWRDTRGGTGNSVADEIDDFPEHSSLFECLPLLMISKLAWLQRESNSALVQTDDLVLMLPTWFVLQLTGVAVVDTNIASMSGLYSLLENRWWGRALEVCDIRESNLPACAGLGSIAGVTEEAARRYGLPPGIPVVLAGNDQTAGAYGAQISEDGALLVTLGTAQVVYSVCRDLPVPEPGVMRGPYPESRYYQLVADEHGAGTVSWACGVLNSVKNEQEFDLNALKASADYGGVIFTADETGDHGYWTGGSPDVSDGDRAGAVLEFLVNRLSDMIGRLDEAAESKPLLLAGGGVIPNRGSN